MKDQILKDLKSLITRISDEANELDALKDDIEAEFNKKPDEPDASEFSDEEIIEEYEYRNLKRRSDIATDDWKRDLFEEHAHKFTLEEIEKFLNSK